MSTGVYVSSWTEDTSQTSHFTAFDHGLGVIPQSLLVLFSPDQQTTYPLNWSWQSGVSGNPVTIEMDATAVRINVAAGIPLHGVFNGSNAVWTSYNSGYWQVIAKATP